MGTVWKWDQALETGVGEIDRQHKELLERGNQLVAALGSNQKEKALTDIFEFLNGYVIEHFRDEEKLQQERGYPKYEMHKAMHDSFIKELGRIREELFTDGITPGVSLSITSAIYEWLVEHIGIEDKALADYIKNG